jgi:tRNA(Ile)-lysidine synthase
VSSSRTLFVDESELAPPGASPPRSSGPDPWSSLAASAGIQPGEKLLLALSGGADSVFLLHTLATAAVRPPLLAVHVDHGLRGEESDLDAAFCAQLCASLGVPLRTRRLALDPSPAGLEARARRARYGALVEEARSSGHRTILTAHHADDALETLLLRWVRGTHPSGMAGLRVRRSFREAPDVDLVRPLLSLRREQIRRSLTEQHLGWREDSSNRDTRFARNKLRHEVLPSIQAAAGAGAIENLFQFARAVGELESALGDAAAHLRWAEPRYPAAAGPARASAGVLARGALMELSTPVRRRALVRLLTEATARAPGRAVLGGVLRDLATGRCSTHALPGGWSLRLRPRALELEAPARATRLPQDTEASSRGPSLPFPELAGARVPELATARVPGRAPVRADPDSARSSGSNPPGTLRLTVPGSVRLPDGRRILAELLHCPASRPVPRGLGEVELDAEALALAGDASPFPNGGVLTVRGTRPGDRFHPLGAPGSKPLRRFLSDAGVARAERGSVPLVCLGEQVIWVGGVRPCEPARVRDSTRWRLRLSLIQAECTFAQP